MIDLEAIITTAKSEGGETCPICERAVAKGERAIVTDAEVKLLGPIAKRIRKEFHAECAERAAGVIVKRAMEARKI